MCASNELVMESSQVRRFSTRSSAATTIGSDDTLISPLGSPNPWSEQLSGPDPLILTGPDNRQWIDLDIISPKLLQELRHRNVLPSTEENPKALSKGAAKIKAWARQGKRGIDVRLGRKLEGRPTEFTDLNIPSDVASPGDHKNAPGQYDLVVNSTPELPGTPNAVHELPGTSTPQELESSECAIARSSSGRSSMSACETLPRYDVHPMSGMRTRDSSRPPRELPGALSLDTAVRPNSSHSSILPTPTKIAGILDAKLLAAIDHSNTPCAKDRAQNMDDTDAGVGDSATSPPRPARDSDAGGFQDILPENDVSYRLELPSPIHSTPGQSRDSVAMSGPSTFSVKETASSSELTAQQSTRNPPQLPQNPGPTSLDYVAKPPGAQAVQRTNGEIHLTIDQSRSGHASTDRVTDQTQISNHLRGHENPRGLARRYTDPLEVPGTASVEELWHALLKAQAQILGSEHPLTYQGKHEFSLSRKQQHSISGQDILRALRQTETIAQETLGLHPLVSSFVSNLRLLEHLTSGTTSESSHMTDGHNTDALVSAGSSSAAMAVAQLPETQVMGDEDRSSGTSPDASSPGYIERSDEQLPPDSARQSPSELPRIFTSLTPSSNDPTPPPNEMNPWANTWQAPHKPQNPLITLSGLIFTSMTRSASAALMWLHQSYGPEPQVEPGKVRVRWTCSCGSQLYDDFVERRPGAGRELEAYLNRPRTRQHNGGSPTSPASSQGSRVPSGSSSGVPSTQTSWTSYGSASNQASPIETRTSQRPSSQGHTPFYFAPEPPWLLTCANESRYTPKLAHLDMSSHKITSDRDLALALRKHYFRVNQKWYRTLKLRGLTTVEFVQFEVHQNRFTDIRKCPDMPPLAAKDYAFEPGELIPPVGPAYLLHLFKHPQDYDGELITYLRVPKKSGRLSIGVGWGIHLVEGFLPDRVWMLLSGLFALASLIFGIVYSWKKQDVQGAFGVAAWICGLALLSVGWLQAGLG